MISLEQHIIELEAELSACPDPIERLQIEADLMAARHEKQRIEATDGDRPKHARYAPRTRAAHLLYHPWLGFVSPVAPAFDKTHDLPWTAGELAAELEAVALEMHMAHSYPARAAEHIRIALQHLHEMQFDLSM